MSKNTISDPELILTRMIDAPPEKGFQAWTETKLLEQWFTPKPWTTSIVKSDLRPGGSSWIVMRNPEVEEFPNPGFYLEVIKNKKMVFTDAYTSTWVPSEKLFSTGIITIEEEGGKKIPPGNPLDCDGLTKT